MTVLFIIAIALALAGLGFLLFGHGAQRLGGLAATFLFALVAVACVITTVDARSVGVQTSMGRYVDTLGPGWSLTAPWSSVEKWTTRLQTSHFQGDGKVKDGEERDNYHREGCVGVKLVAEQTACVDVTVEWGVTEKSVKALWESYKDFETARRNYVNTEVRMQVGAVFEGYDPFLKLRDPEADANRGTYEQFSAAADAKLRTAFDGRGLVLKAVRVTYIDYSAEIDNLLRELTVAVGRTRIAEQDVETAKKQAAAAAERNNATKVKTGCEALMRDLAAANQLQHLPAGWQCPGVTGPAVVGAR